MPNHYNFIVTYSFSDDEVRDSFTDFLIINGFEEEPDQSTYSLDASEDLTSRELISIIKKWIDNVNDFDVDDVIVVYYPSVAIKRTIIRRVFQYDSNTGKLI